MIVETILRAKGSNVITISPLATVKNAAILMREKNISALAVTTGERIHGIITEREIVRGAARFGDNLTAMPVKAIMNHDGVTASPEDTSKELMSKMTRHRIRHLLVIRDNKLAGIISIGDVVKQRLELLELETNVLRDVYLAAR
jgi:CBS domain-containing protein